MKSIRKREDERQKRYDIVRYIREHGSTQRDSKICQTSPHTINERKKRNTLPYQETEAFKSLLKEYKEKAKRDEELTPEGFSEKSLSKEELRSDSTNDTFYIFQKNFHPNESTDNDDDETTN
ncbi:uncharacterized protein LOC122504353 [Leptopilina heterotoma]|uniref:uncharacterized protein LOC122504353 n=1 Tax=Leptopilina heterotoma TaxID=63436 RepID=UPI001CA832BC|nr:uncharacterized protein LOC122504353 [Leptopilina heterotoma]